jgi:hypothetical protein
VQLRARRGVAQIRRQPVAERRRPGAEARVRAIPTQQLPDLPADRPERAGGAGGTLRPSPRRPPAAAEEGPAPSRGSRPGPWRRQRPHVLDPQSWASSWMRQGRAGAPCSGASFGPPSIQLGMLRSRITCGGSISHSTRYRYAMATSTRVFRSRWIDEGPRACVGGPDAVRIDPPAKALGVTPTAAFHSSKSPNSTNRPPTKSPTRSLSPPTERPGYARSPYRGRCEGAVQTAGRSCCSAAPVVGRAGFRERRARR